MMERRPWRAVDSDLFRFTTTDLRELHVAVMAAFEQAAVLAPALNLDQVRAALTATGWDEPVDDESLQRTLASLTDGVCSRPRRTTFVGSEHGNALLTADPPASTGCSSAPPLPAPFPRTKTPAGPPNAC